MVFAVTFVGNHQRCEAGNNVFTVVNLDESDSIVNECLSYFCIVNWFRRITSNQQDSKGQ